ncbi:hypothetical protein JKP88DRAFT_264141 [Tribonema minus]|uniref:Chaperone DnaJ C-terminal domain-containing protein n=1 Tax=Tribonema minus TaxID=303371 RepID=A0A835YSR4_9STRA|nr:hypothetical protein JKP88DRAFT_264141 [Tribonema minus]
MEQAHECVLRGQYADIKAAKGEGTALTMPLRPVVFVRYNPDSREVDGVRERRTRAAKGADLMSVLSDIERCALALPHPLNLVYVNYITYDKTPVAPAIEHQLAVSLEDLYSGTTKKMRITRKTLDGGTASTDKEIKIKPGWKDGTRVTFERQGDEQAGVVPADVVFIIKTKPHDRFKRVDNDLIYEANVTLQQALSGVDTVLETLDGRRLRVSEPFLPSSTYETRITGEGMPSHKNASIKGDLVVKYIIKLPFNGAERQRVARALASA